MSATELSPDLRKLIDARLDVVDRTLIQAEVSWSERRSIVGELETQIFELLSRRGGISAEHDVLEVLGSLDPPESYLPDGVGPVRAGAPDARISGTAAWLKGIMRRASRLGEAAAWVMGLVVADGVILMIVAASDGTIQWIVTLAALAWLNYAGVRRFRVWQAEHRGRVLDDARKSLGAWLLAKDGAAAT